MEQLIQVGDLAQRALADAFDQLAQVGNAGSAACHRYVAMPFPPSKRVKAQTARALLASAHAAVRYAEQQLQYLDVRSPECSDSAADDADPDDRPADESGVPELLGNVSGSGLWLARSDGGV